MTHSKNRWAGAAALISLSFVMSSCGAAPETAAEQSADGSSTSASDVKVCMVAGLGGLDDKSFNQSGWEGLQRAKEELGVEIAVSETFSDSDYVPQIQIMVDEGCDLVIGVSYMMTDAITDAAKKYPDVKFALVDDVIPENLPNARGVVFNTAEATFLAGYLAAGMSETDAVGTFMGGKIVPTMLFADGFVDGVKKYNEDHDSDVLVIGWDKEAQDGMATGDFEDVAKGKNFARELINQGADVLMPVAGVVGTGALSAARDSGDTAIIWVDVDGYLTETQYSDLFLTSVLKEIGNALYTTVEELVAGEFSSEDYIGTLENQGVGLAPWHDFEDRIPAELKAELQTVREQIIDGQIIVESPSAP